MLALQTDEKADGDGQSETSQHRQKRPMGDLLEFGRELSHREVDILKVLFGLKHASTQRPTRAQLFMQNVTNISLDAGSVPVTNVGRLAISVRLALDGLIVRGCHMVTVSQLIAMKSHGPSSTPRPEWRR